MRLHLMVILQFFFASERLVLADGIWQMVAQNNSPTPRHECSFVEAGKAFLLMGGRESQIVESFDFETRKWTQLAKSPVLMHHFQATNMAGVIVVLGAFTGGYPAEPSVPDLWYYDPLGNAWIKGAPIPVDRLRGASGVVLLQDKVYLMCGNTRGHNSGWVKWADVWDPATNAWNKLPDAPHARDHFMAVAHNGKIYCGGGRRSSQDLGNTFGDVEANVDVYDVASRTWTTLAYPMPTPRAAPQTGIVGKEILYAGGESGKFSTAVPVCEALDLNTGSWHTYDKPISPRHATQGIVNNGGFYTAAGSPTMGGGTIGTQVAFFPAGITTEILGSELLEGRIETSAFEAIRSEGKNSITVPISYQGGNQALLISSIKLVNAGGAKIVDSVVFPIFLLPGKAIQVKIALSGSIPKTAFLSIETLIPANRKFSRPFSTPSTSELRLKKTVQKIWRKPKSRTPSYGHNPVDSKGRSSPTNLPVQ